MPLRALRAEAAAFRLGATGPDIGDGLWASEKGFG